MREHVSHGRRMYYLKRGKVLIVMLSGGAKATQAADITKAVEYAAQFEE